MSSHLQKSNLPQAVEIEEAVLGALLMDHNALVEVIDALPSKAFYLRAHRLIYQAIIALFKTNGPIDPRTVLHQLRKMDQLEEAGGAEMVAHLTGVVVSTQHLESHTKILIEQAMRRDLIATAATIHKQALDPTLETVGLIDQAEQSLFEVTNTSLRKQIENIKDLMQSAIEALEVRKNHKGELVGISTGFSLLDQLILGWQQGDFVVIAGRPGMGKTAFLLSLLRNAAIDHQVPTAFFSLEMSSLQLINRMISASASLPSDKIKTGKLERHEWAQLYHKTGELAKGKIYIDDTPSLSLLELRAKSRRLSLQKGVKLIFVDYLQLMVEGGRTSGHFNREQQISAISRGIKAVAKELNITFIVASQLSRSVEIRGGDKRPQLSDLRESGAIEQDADLVLFLYRGEYYGLTQDLEGHDIKNVAEVIISKHRNGPTGKVLLHYTAETTKFSNFKQTRPR